MGRRIGSHCQMHATPIRAIMNGEFMFIFLLT